MKCHKIKLVRVTMPRASGVQMGICANCETKKERKND